MARRYGEFGAGLWSEHVLTRSVRDSAALLDATAGAESGDPYTAPAPRRPFLEEVGREPGPLRIGLVLDPGLDVTVDEDCRSAATTVAETLRRLGHEVQPLTVDTDPWLEPFSTIQIACIASEIDEFSQRTRRIPSASSMGTVVWELYRKSGEINASQYVSALRNLHRIGRQYAAYFDGVDVILSPTLAQPPLPLGTFHGSETDPLQAIRSSHAYFSYTPLANISGFPAMSVPTCRNARELPVGVHLTARYGDEATLFRLAGQLEAALPWAHRMPPMCTDLLAAPA